jgi:hypothetical protein
MPPFIAPVKVTHFWRECSRSLRGLAILAPLVALLLAGACSSPVGDGTATDAAVADSALIFPDHEAPPVLDDATAVRRLFAGCAGDGRESLCHGAAAGGFTLNLAPRASGGDTIGAPSTEVPALLRVAPGDPDGSYLLKKLEGSAGILGDRMGSGDPAESALVRRWILSGAR